MTNLGRLVLFSAALLWGVSFVVMKNVLTNIPPLCVLAIRFCGAALLLLPFAAGKLKTIDKSYLRGGAIMGAALLIAYAFQTYGLMLTTPGKNAFLTSTYCVITPFLYWVFVKRKPDKFNAAAAIVCIAGIGLITLDDDLRIGTGDALTLVSGFFFAVHIVATARIVEDRNPVVLAMLQFATVGLLSFIGAAFFEQVPATFSSADILSIIFLMVVCTAACLLMQVLGQKYTPPSQAAVILTFESVFGVVFSVILVNEQLSAKVLLGFALTFAAVVISETKLGFLKKANV